MNALVLILTTVISFPFCLFRIKKYNISLVRMLFIYAVFSCVGAVGACLGAFAAGEMIIGKRLYGLMILDTAALFIMSRVLGIQVGCLGDFIAVPIMATCFSSKIDCLVHGCCYGFTIYQPEMQQPVRFPSAILEMVIWGLFTLVLLYWDKKGQLKNMLWPLAMTWFGLIRFVIDFLRGSALEKNLIFYVIPGAKFWSLVAMSLGMVHLYYCLKVKLNRKPSRVEFIKTVAGKSVET